MHTPAAGGTASNNANLATPAIAWVQAQANFQVVLRSTKLNLHTYRVPLAGSTGTFLNYNGVLVTSLSQVSSSAVALRREVINNVFSDVYGIPEPTDPTADQHLANPDLNHQIHACYTDAPDSNCAILPSAPSFRVWPYNTETPPEGIPADLLATNSGLVTLRIGGNNVPTEAISTSPGSGHREVLLLGFHDRPGKGSMPVVVPAEVLAAPSGTTLEEAAAVEKQLGDGLSGAAIIDKGSTALIGIFTGAGPEGTGVTLSTPIVKALSGSGITPGRSAVDSDFITAEDFFNSRHYDHAIDGLTDVVRLNRGQPVASAQLKIAKAKLGTAEDLSNEADSNNTSAIASARSGRSLAWWAWALIAVGVAGLLLGSYVFAGRRSRRAAAGTPGTDGPLATASAVSRTPLSGVRPAAPPHRDVSAPGSPSSPLQQEQNSPVGPQGTTRVVAAPEEIVPQFRRQRHCTQCAAQLAPDARFCGYCAAPTGR